MHKIPKEQIILMMYDDIAQNERNPFRGKVFSSRYEDDLYTGKYRDDNFLISNLLDFTFI